MGLIVPFLRATTALAAGCLMLAPASAASERRPALKVFLLAGQSNLAGRAPGEALPLSFRSPPGTVRFDYVCSFGAKGSGPGRPDPHASDGWVPLEPSPQHTSTPGSHFGPEIGLGHALAADLPGQPIALVKHGRGATILATDWAPEASDGRRLYAAFVAQVRSALARLADEGFKAEIAAFIWCQGEGDSTRAEWAAAYQRNLAALIDTVRRDFSAPRLPVVIVLTGDGCKNPVMTHAETVRAAQRSVAAEDPATTLVSADDLNLLDNVHYDAPAQLEIGRRLARTFRDLSTIGRANFPTP